MTQVELRQAEAIDEPVLWEMLYLAVFVPPGHDPMPRSALSQPELARYVRGWGRPSDLGVIAVATRGPVGSAWLRLWSADQTGYGYVDPTTPELCMAVRPEWRGRGVGTRLLEGLLRLADPTHERVSLSVSLLNPAVRLYRRFGFVPVTNDAAAMTMVRNRGAWPPGR